MEKILKFSVILMLVLMVVFAYAVGVYFPKNEKEVQKKTISFAVKDVNKVYVSLYDPKDKLLHSERIHPFNPFNPNGRIVKTYNLTPFHDGIYNLVIESNTKIEKYEILVVGETAAIMSDPYSEEYKTFAIK